LYIIFQQEDVQRLFVLDLVIEFCRLHYHVLS